MGLLAMAGLIVNKFFQSLCVKSRVKLLVEMFYSVVKRDCSSNPEVY